jgi:phenylacetic acid degradation operon negative regulatory protein
MQKSLWVSPYDLSRRIQSVISEMGLEKYVETFSAQHLGRSDSRTLASGIWKLEEFNRRYSHFIDHYHPLLSRLRREARTKGQEMKLLGLKRKIEKDLAQILRNDPQLPDDLLPSDWKGEEAYRLFEECYRLILSSINSRSKK